MNCILTFVTYLALIVDDISTWIQKCESNCKEQKQMNNLNEGTVCFSWINDPCYYSSKIQIVNCGDYYLYNLAGPSEYQVNSRYCST